VHGCGGGGGGVVVALTASRRDNPLDSAARPTITPATDRVSTALVM